MARRRRWNLRMETEFKKPAALRTLGKASSCHMTIHDIDSS
jgi:hypothetical protein